jgi:uncharacterized protein (TIGR02145 family)
MKKIAFTFFLFIHVLAKAQFVGSPYIVPNAQPFSNGSAIVSGYTCSTASAGTMTAGVGVFGVTQTITATVTTIGTYNILATSNGVAFSATGSFTATGNQNIVLIASGTPITAGTNSFTLNTSPNCSFSRTTASFICGTTTVTFKYNGSTVTYGTINSSGQCWLDRNLGAAYKPTTNSVDANTFGDLFQWGRAADGHQIISSSTTTTVSTSNTPGNANFIVTASDWRSPQNDNLWQGVNGINNVCPVGFRLPTSAELETERTSWSGSNSAGAFASPLKLTPSGNRDVSGALTNVAASGLYWSSTVTGTNAYNLKYNGSSAATTNSAPRASGRSVRCIKN